MGATATALVGFSAWYLALSFALGFYRTGLVLSGQKAANSFSPDGSDLPGIGQRLTRARDNCYESLPLFAAIALGASLAGKIAVTDPLALYVLYARIGQSVTHVISTSVPAIRVRFGFFLVQLVIYAWWSLRLFCGAG